MPKCSAAGLPPPGFGNATPHTSGAKLEKDRARVVDNHLRHDIPLRGFPRQNSPMELRIISMPAVWSNAAAAERIKYTCSIIQEANM